MRRPRHFLSSSSVRRAALEALESRTLLSVELVKDINAVATSLGAPTSITDVNGMGFFALAGLWKTDGTVAGTTEIAASVPDASSLCNANGTLFFASGGQLWKSDGSTAGTIKIAPSLGMNPRNITAVGGRVYFIGSDGGGDELWTSDGTDAGTLRVKDINPGSAGSDLREMTNVNGKLFFRADDGTHGGELWISDGTDAGTKLVKDIDPGASSSEPISYTNVNGTLFFVAHNADDSGYELWKSDGTTAGTVQVKDIRAGKPGSSPTSLRNVNGTLMFVATDGITGYELWKSDGTEAGTVLVKDIVPGAASPSIDHLTVMGSTLYFSADDQTGSGIELWKSDGTAAGTVRVADVFAGATSSDPAMLTAVGSTLYFSTASANGSTIYKTDGTAAGTTPLSTPFLFYHVNLQAVGSKLFFNADNGGGLALWTSNGTLAGTIRIPLTAPSLGSSSIGPILKIGSTLFFSANDGVRGQELWKSDGTAAGTVLLADLVPGSGSSAPAELTNFGGTLYFTALSKLWKSDGTTAGTVAVSQTAMGPVKLTVVGSTLYFDGSDGFGQELWKSDGTSAGTARVADIAPGGASSSPDSLTNVNGTLFFVADDTVHGQEVFKSDGTAAGTVLVKDIYPGITSSGPLLLTNVNGTLFFRAGDGVNGWELWKSDGTAAGTQMVKDIVPGAGDSVIHDIIAVGNIAYFIADDGVHGQEIWKSDGTAAGTVLVRDINPGLRGSTPTDLTELNGKLIFRADDGINGGEPWVSDGTEAGTFMLKDVRPGVGSSQTQYIENIGGIAVFSAFDGNFYSPWVSDGTIAGTLRTSFTADYIWPQAGNIVSLGGYLYFSSWNAAVGDEFRRILIPTTASAPATQTAPIAAAPASMPVVANALAAPPASQSSLYPDIFYDNLLDSNMPLSRATSGLMPLSTTSPPYTDQSIAYADETAIRALARQDFAAGQPMVLDIEHWGIDIRSNTEAVVQSTLERLRQIVDWAHDECPGLSVGFYALMPIETYPAPAPLTGAWQAANDRVKSLIDKVDVLYANPPNAYPEQTATWLTSFENTVAEGQSYDKPVRPFLNMHYGLNPDGADRITPPDVWRMELDVAHDVADGAVLWDAETWDDNAPWWTVTRDFLIDSTPMRPAAASGLQVGATTASSVALTWTDNAYNETGWRVERRTGSSGPFTEVGTLPADAVSFTDTTASPSSSYTYHVIPFNSSGDGFASNEAVGVTQSANVAPPTPFLPSAGVDSFTNIRVNWAPASQNETGFKVERSQGGGAYVEVASLPAGASSFLDISAAPDTSYGYRILAYNSFGNAAYTTPVVTSLLGSKMDPRGVWKFDDASGTTATDSSIGFHAGTLVNGPTWTSSTLGNALNFDGVDDHVDVADASDLRFTQSQDFTLSAWVDLVSLPGRRVSIVAKSHGSGAWYSIGIDATNHWIVSGPGGDVVGPLATTGWTHLAAVQVGTAGTRTLYVNGVAVASGAAQAGDGGGDLWIGGAESVSEFFAGTIDDVRLYGSAWSAADLNVLAHPRVTLNGTAGSNAFVLQVDPNANTYQVLDNNAAIFTAPRDAVASIDVVGGSADDQLTVDFSTGEAMPLLGLSFDGGSGGHDTLSVIGRSGISLTGDASHLWRGSNAITYSNIDAFDIASVSLATSVNLNADVTLENQAVATFASSQTIGSLTLNAGSQANVTSGADKVLSLNNLSIAAGASLDLSDNAMAIHYSNSSPIGGWNGSAYTGVTGMIASGDNRGAWNGSGIVTSMPGVLSPQPNRTLVAVEASQLLNLSGNQTTQWHNQTVDAKTVLVMNAAIGDADLNGSVNGDDYFMIDAGFASHAQGFANGDFDYSGRIDADDYFLIDRNYSVSQQTASAPPLAATAVASAANASPPPYVPQNSPFADSSIESAYDKLHQDDTDLATTLL